MSNITYTQHTRLSDSLERDVLRHTLSNGERLSIVAVFKTAFNAIKKVTFAFGNYLVEVAEFMNEARANDSRFSRSQW